MNNIQTKIKKIRLQRYCGYRDTIFDFTKENTINNFCVFYGPNGIGKTTVLEAIDLLCNAKRLASFINTQDKEQKNESLFFRKIIYNAEYIPGYAAYEKPKEPMILTGWFDVNGEEKIVQINSEEGVINELPHKDIGHCMFIDADHPINLNNFQLHTTESKRFLDMAHTVYGFECELNEAIEACTDLSNSYDQAANTGEEFHTDFIIHKKLSGTKIHYKRMSDGEKKIATLLRNLCDTNYIDQNHIILIDNAEKEIYFKRHMPLVNKLKEVFPDKQFFLTTHSSVIVNNLPKEELYDIEEYRNRELENHA